MLKTSLASLGGFGWDSLGKTRHLGVLARDVLALENDATLYPIAYQLSSLLLRDYVYGYDVSAWTIA